MTPRLRPSEDDAGRERGDGRRFVAVLFVDIVGSTRAAQELGDARWRECVKRYQAVMREALRRFGGQEVDMTGDESFSVYDSPGRAVRAARSMLESVRTLGIEVRAGVHAGEVDVSGPSVRGIAVIVGSRVMTTAGAGEIRVSQTVRDAVAGSGITFVDAGDHELKGVEGRWALSRVDTVDGKALEAPLTEEEAESRRAAIEVQSPGRKVGPIVVAAVGVLALLVGSLIAFGRKDTMPPKGVSHLARIELAADSVEATIPLGSEPSAVLGASGELWVADIASSEVFRVDPATGRTRRVEIGGAPTGMATDGKAVWVVAGFAGRLVRIEPDTLETERFDVPTGSFGIATAAGSVWLTNFYSNDVLRIDLQTGTRQGIPVGAGPRGIAFGADSLWVANTLDKTVTRLDAETGNVIDCCISVLFSPFLVAADDDEVWVTHQIDNQVSRIDPMSLTTTTRRVGRAPTGVLLIGEALWVANSRDGTVTRLPTLTNGPGETIDVGGSPEGIGVLGGAVWVAIHQA
jgi:class 3 adenylate cyclase/DNA-binding beta-propeller fold protein YncE